MSCAEPGTQHCCVPPAIIDAHGLSDLETRARATLCWARSHQDPLCSSTADAQLACYYTADGTVDLDAARALGNIARTAVGDVAVACVAAHVVAGAAAQRVRAAVLAWGDVNVAAYGEAGMPIEYSPSNMRVDAAHVLRRVVRAFVACGRRDAESWDNSGAYSDVKCPQCCDATPAMRDVRARAELEHMLRDMPAGDDRDDLSYTLYATHSTTCVYSMDAPHAAEVSLLMAEEMYGTPTDFRRMCTRMLAAVSHCATGEWQFSGSDVHALLRRYVRVAVAEIAIALAAARLPALLVTAIIDALDDCFASAGEYFCRRVPELVGQLARRADTPSD